MFVEPPANIAILGAGPVGLEAAIYARYLGYQVELIERGGVADNVLRWGHVRMFSPFGMNASPLGLAALAAQDDSFNPPGDDELLTGAEWTDRYLIPLSQSDLLVDGLRTGTTVLGVGRAGLLKGERIGQPERADFPFRLLLRDGQGRESTTQAEVVIDTTGTFANHNWLGQGGIPAAGEIAAQSNIEYGLPDILGADRGQYAGKHVLVVGAGYSAATNLVALARIAEEDTSTQVTWVTRGKANGGSHGPVPHIPNDRLAARDELATRANSLAAEGGPVRHLPDTSVDAISWDETARRFSVQLIGEHAGEGTFDRVVANVGYRPDASLYEELQVHQCYATGGPMKLAAELVGQTSPDCLDQTSAGAQSLITTEPNFYILGSKSYGRNSKFLFSMGLEQVRQLFTLIADREDLDLYASTRAPVR